MVEADTCGEAGLGPWRITRVGRELAPPEGLAVVFLERSS